MANQNLEAINNLPQIEMWSADQGNWIPHSRCEDLEHASERLKTLQSTLTGMRYRIKPTGNSPKPFSSYPEDRAKLLELCNIIESTNHSSRGEDIFAFEKSAIDLADLVKAILEDEQIAIKTKQD